MVQPTSKSKHIVKKPRFLYPALLALLVVAGPASAAPGILKLGDGWYKQRFKSAGVIYIGDSIGRTCYVAVSTRMTQVTCKPLKRRPEWATIITCGKK